MAKFFGGEAKPKSTSAGSSPQTATAPFGRHDEATMRQPSSQASPPSDRENVQSNDEPLDAVQLRARTLVVGPQIVLSGEVRSCNRLVVQGTIRANIKECRDIAIAEGGLFTGSAAVQNAEISGRFEGELKVSGRLFIRSAGLVSGKVQYEEIEIERGGHIAGDVSATNASDQRSATA